MKFGRFDDAQKEYVIHTPAIPLPWINYLGNEEFFGLISNTMGGYCFYQDAEYDIHIRQTGTRSMAVNGQAVESDRFPLFPAGSRVQVEVTL